MRYRSFRLGISTNVTIAFDTLRLADRLEAGGFTMEQAKTAASALSDAFQETITAKDLDRAIERVEESIAGLEQRVDARFEAFEQRMDAKFESLEQRMNARFESMNAKFEGVDARFENFAQRLDAQELRIVVKVGGMLVVMVGLIGVLFKILH